MRILRTSWVLGLVLLSAVWTAPVVHCAEPIFNTGCMVETSPFYDKLLRAGVFDTVTQPALRAEPMQVLLMKAHLFRYTSEDRSKKETWQSADETARIFQGDCADKAIWLYTHLKKNGYQNVSLIIGRYSPSSRVLHMWVTYVEPSSGNTLLLDPTMQRKAWKVTDFPKRFYKPVYILNGDNCVAV